MNPEVQQAINNINAYIVENHNNEITANVLNPILIELANLFDIVGDLSDLNTTDNDSIVSAINWVLNQISSGITIHSGQANPNVTPPAFFAVGDLYSRVDVLDNPYQIYIYNGAEWAEIRQVINDSIIGLDTTWSSEKISEAIQGDRLENVPTIDLVGNEITISNASWWIQGVNYNLSPDFEDTINYTSVAGMMRKDIIVAVAGNSMLRIQGTESDTNPLEPTVPPNTLLVTSIDVFHDSLGDVEPPIVGEQYVKKMGYRNLYLTGSVTTAPVLSEDKRNTVIQSYTGAMVIDGFKDGMPGQPSTLYQGMIVTIDNQTSEEVPLNDMTNSTNPNSDIKMDFRSGISQYVMKPGELLTFKLRGSVLVFVSTNQAETDGLVLGETSTTAYRGDRGKTAYDHSQETGNPHGTTLQQVVDEDGIVADKSVRFMSAAPNSSRVDIGNNDIKVSNVTDGNSTKIGVQEIVFEQGGNELNIQPEAIDDDYNVTIQAKNHTVAGLDDVENATTAVQRTGSEVAFDLSAVYGTTSSPCTGNITYDFTDAKFDMVQTMFHEDTTVPTFGVGTVVSGEYEVEVLNVITFRRLSNSEVFIKIQQITV